MIIWVVVRKEQIFKLSGFIFYRKMRYKNNLFQEKEINWDIKIKTVE
jgi:hypothetical protein